MDFINTNNLATFSPCKYSISKTFLMPNLELMTHGITLFKAPVNFPLVTDKSNMLK